MRALSCLALLFAPLALLGGCKQVGQADSAPEAAQQGKIAVDEIDAAVMAARMAAGEIVLVDVRTPEEFDEGHIEGAVNMPLDSFDPAAVPKAQGKETVIYCRSGRRSEMAAQYLSETTGETAVHLDGGILAWEEAGEPVVTD